MSVRSAALGSPMDGRDRSDVDLLTQVAHGDVGAFEIIYDRHSGAAWRVALLCAGDEEAAERAVEEAFLELWRDPIREHGASVSARLLGAAGRNARRAARAHPTRGTPMSSTVQSETGLMMATVNQQIDRLHTFFHLADSDFFCECGDRACTERVTLSRAEYAARTARSPSVLAPAHGGSNHRAIDLAKRLLAERGEMEPIEAFEILRSRARAQQRSLDAVCADYIAVIADREPDDDTAAQREKRARLGR